MAKLAEYKQLNSSRVINREHTKCRQPSLEDCWLFIYGERVTARGGTGGGEKVKSL